MTTPIESASHPGFRPGRVWSLLDIMQRFRAASFLASATALSRASAMVEGALHFHDPGDFPADRELVKLALDEAAPSLDELPLSRVLCGQFQRIQDAIQRGAPGAELTVMLREYLNNLMTELAQPWFLMIPASQRNHYEQITPPFGDAVGETFPDANKDIAAASRCLALEEWTASVFHVMRVLEHGLRALAANVGLEADAMAHENWKNVIENPSDGR